MKKRYQERLLRRNLLPKEAEKAIKVLRKGPISIEEFQRTFGKEYRRAKKKQVKLELQNQKSAKLKMREMIKKGLKTKKNVKQFSFSKEKNLFKVSVKENT